MIQRLCLTLFMSVTNYETEYRDDRTLTICK